MFFVSHSYSGGPTARHPLVSWGHPPVPLGEPTSIMACTNMLESVVSGFVVSPFSKNDATNDATGGCGERRQASAAFVASLISPKSMPGGAAIASLHAALEQNR